VPGEARATGERGYAELLAHQDAAAGKDLRTALAAAHDGKLQAQLWYNLGLLTEQDGDLDGARRAYARSNQLHATRAAASKIASGPVCLAEIARDPKAAAALLEIDTPIATVATFHSWSEVYRALADPDDVCDQDATPPKDDAEAKKRLCGEDGCQGAAPWDVAAGCDTLRSSVVIPQGTDLQVYENLAVSSNAQEFLCYGGRAATYADHTADGMHVHAIDLDQQMYSFCDDDDCSDGSSHDCDITYFVGDYYFDASGHIDLYVQRSLIDGSVDTQLHPGEQPEQPDPAHEHPEVTLSAAPDGVRLAGGGCDQTLTFRP